MNQDELQKKLVAVARNNPPGDAVPYAFEKRVMANLPRTRLFNTWAFWERGMARSAAFCVALMLFTTGLSRIDGPGGTEGFSTDFEQTLFAGVDASVDGLGDIQ